MRNRRLLARRLASTFDIFSPVYSAIFRRAPKCAIEKQPLPSIGLSLIVNPGARFSLMRLIVTQTRSLQVTSISTSLTNLAADA